MGPAGGAADSDAARGRGGAMAQPSLDDKRKQKEAGDFFMQGKNHFRNKDMSAALDAFTHAIMLRPEKAEYFYNRGNCYNRINETQKALLDYSMRFE